MTAAAKPDTGRRFRAAAVVALADAAPDGRARFDAIARWLQDVAYADVADAGLAQAGAWVVRRTRIEVARFPRFGEPLELETWCSGLGRMWAERRTTVNGGAVETVALWIHLDPQTGRPRPLDPSQLVAWEPSTAGRRVKARLRHPAPPASAASVPWTFRAADLDVAGHVNNAAYWTVLEEEIGSLERADAEIEFRGAALAGPAVVRRDGGMTWVSGPDGEIHASIALTMQA